MSQHPNKSTTSCIILAGGKGKRLGNRDKGLIRLEDKPLIEHVIERIRSQVDDIVISANRNIDTYQRYSDTVIEDESTGFQGPLTGIASCLPHCRHEWVLVLPCDIPKIPTDIVEKLCMDRDDKLIVAEVNGKHQLVFLMHISLQASLNDFLDHGHKKVMSWIDLNDPGVVSFDSENDPFMNMNTQDILNTF